MVLSRITLAVSIVTAAAGCGVHDLQAVTLPGPICENPPPTLLSDRILFGDPGSEAAHAFAGPGTIVGSGASGASNRRIDVGAPLQFQLATAPDAQDYLTVKLWGSDPDPAALFLYVAGVRVGQYQHDLPELDLNVGEAVLPGRFLYVTYPLPRAATDGKTAVPLKIDAAGSVSAFADPVESPLTQPTRPIYAAYTHTDPFFVPAADEVQGQAPDVALRPAPSNYPDLALLHQRTDAVVATLLSWQLYGDAWTAAVRSGGVPRAVLALFAANTTPTQVATPAAWKDWAVSVTTGANAIKVKALSVLALIYGAPWSRYFQSGDILARVTGALDSLALMQGANGAFTSAKWAGAPVRVAAVGSSTEGSGTKAIGRAFTLLADDLARAGILDALVDADDDPATPGIPRRQAWADMFAAHRDFLASAPGRSADTMYDQSQVEALWLANQALRTLAPDRAWSQAAALAFADSAVGIGDAPVGGRWVSPLGLPLEPSGTLAGSYDGRWGILTIRSMCSLARLTGDPDVRASCVKAVHATAPFIYPSSDAGGRTFRSESTIAGLVNSNPGFVEYGGNSFAAQALGDPVARRALELTLAQYQPLDPPPATGVHFTETLADYLDDLPAIEGAGQLPASGYRLPMEDGQPDFVWLDAVAGNAAIRNCGDRVYAALNWRRGFTDGVPDAQHARVNDIARVHLTNDRYDRIATIAMESPFGFGRFYLAAFGPYLIGMNASVDATYDLVQPAPGPAWFDLVSRRRGLAATAVSLAPGQSHVLYRQPF